MPDPDSPMRSALANRDERLLLAGLGLSALAGWLSAVALTVWVWDRTHSLAWVAVANALRLVPAVLLDGVSMERRDRRRVLVVARLAGAALVLALAALVAARAPVAVALVLAALAAAASSAERRALAVLTPAVVGGTDFAAACALAEAAAGLAMVLGPAVAGVLLALAATWVCFAVAGAALLVAAVLAALVRQRPEVAAEQRLASLAARVGAGRHALTRSRDAAVLVGLVVAAAFVYGQELVLLVAVAAERLGTGAEGLGYLLAAAGAGALAAAGFSGWLDRARLPGRMVLLATLALGVPLVLLALVRAPVLACALLVVEGFGGAAFAVLATTLLQRAVPADLLDRVRGLLDAAVAAGLVLGSVVAPLLVTLADLPAALAAAGLIMPLLGFLLAPRLAVIGRTAEQRRVELLGRVRVIDQLEIFEGAPPTAVEALAAALVEEPFRAGDVLVREGDTAGDFFVVRAGMLDLTGDTGDRSLAAGDAFGEAGLFDAGTRTVTVRAVTDGLLYRVRGDDFLAAVCSSSELPGVLRLAANRRMGRAQPSRRPSGAEEPEP